MAAKFTFGDWLKQRRRQLDLTQKEMAAQSGCSVNTVRKIESNARRPSKQLAELMAVALAIPAGHQAAFVTFARTEAYTTDMPAGLKALAEQTDLTPPRPPIPVADAPKSYLAHPESEFVQHNLPVQPTPFLGRQAELAALARYLADPHKRLITIVGPGGMGKTRLAIACAGQYLESTRFPDGIFFVALAPLSDSDQVATAITDALHISMEVGGQQGRSLKQQLLDFVAKKQLLLILDNFEHLPAAAGLVNELLETAAQLVVIVTSRERLHLRAEQLYPIGGLEFPDWETPADAAEYTAVKLFVQSAQQVLPDFALATPDLTYLSRICRLVGGMPLAVELAAGWVDLLPLKDIAAELQDSLDILATELHDVPKRQRSIRAVFDASWQRMSPAEREIFSRLSVFRGGFGREAGQTVAGATLLQLSSLVSKSLLQVDRKRNRYNLHELLRQYAGEKLATDSAQELLAYDRHSAFYCTFMEKQGSDLRGPKQKNAAGNIHMEIDNCRTAWNWAVNHAHIDRQLGALEGLANYMFEWAFYYQEAHQLFSWSAEKVAQIDSVEATKLKIHLLTWQMSFNEILGRRDQSQNQIKTALTLLEQPPLSQIEQWSAKAAILTRLAIVIHFSDRSKAQRLAEQILTLTRTTDDRSGEARILTFLAMLTMTQGHVVDAERLGRKSLSIYRELGNHRWVAQTLTSLAIAVAKQNRLEEAELLINESITINCMLDIRRSIARALINLGRIHLMSGQADQALLAFEEAELHFGEYVNDYFLAFLWQCQGNAHLYLGSYEVAEIIGGRSLELGQQIGRELTVALALQTLGQVELAKINYAAAEIKLLESISRCRTYGQTGMPFALASGLSFLSLARLGMGKIDLARRHLTESLRIVRRCYALVDCVLPLAAATLVFLELGQSERAVELYALTRTHPSVADSRWYADVCGQVLATAATLPSHVASTAIQRGRVLGWWETVDSVLDEL